MTLLPELPDMYELTASYVAGKWAAGTDDGKIAVRSPATDELLGTVGIAGSAEVDAAVAAARAALTSSPWGDISPADRAAALGRLADGLAARKGVLGPPIADLHRTLQQCDFDQAIVQAFHLEGGADVADGAVAGAQLQCLA